MTCVLYFKKNEQINKNLWVTLTPCLKTSRKEPNAGAIITSALGAKLTQHAFLSCSYILHGFKIKCNKIHHLLSKHTSSELNPRCKQRYSMKAKIKHLATCHHKMCWKSLIIIRPTLRINRKKDNKRGGARLLSHQGVWWWKPNSFLTDKIPETLEKQMSGMKC